MACKMCGSDALARREPDTGPVYYACTDCGHVQAREFPAEE